MNFNNKTSKTLTFLTVFCLLAISPAKADDGRARSLLQQADSLFSQRNEESLNPTNQAIAKLSQALEQTDQSELRYKILLLRSRAYYWNGTVQSSRSDKMDTFEKAMESAEEAASENDEYANAYYRYGIALARWAEAKGILESLGRKDELIEFMQTTQDLETMDEKEGYTIDGYGPDRVFGKMYFKLPSWAGGNLNKSMKHLKRAVDNAPFLAMNTAYYSESLIKGSREQKKKGCQLLDLLVKKSANDFPKERKPETTRELRDAMSLYKKKCK